MIGPASTRPMVVYVNNEEVEIQPGTISFSKKQNAGTSFSIKYPNPGSLSRGVFREFYDVVRVDFAGASRVLEGVVYRVPTGPVADVMCADPLYQAAKENVSPSALNEHTGDDCGRVIGELVRSVGLPYPAETRARTSALGVPLPADFITQESSKRAVIDQLFNYILDQTYRKSPERPDYFMGFVRGVFRFEQLPVLADAYPSFNLSVGEGTLYEEMPTFHFDRLVNIAKAIGGKVDGKAIEGPVYRDEQSIAIFGEKWPPKSPSADTTNKMELYELAKKAVKKGSRLLVTRTVKLPEAYHVTPGLDVVDIADSEYGVVGKGRVIQVEGGYGSGQDVKVTLDVIPADEIEVIIDLVNRNS